MLYWGKKKLPDPLPPLTHISASASVLTAECKLSRGILPFQFAFVHFCVSIQYLIKIKNRFYKNIPSENNSTSSLILLFIVNPPIRTIHSLPTQMHA
jgi:hypothetical protein